MGTLASCFSMSTMILTAFARSAGLAYLRETLRLPLQTVAFRLANDSEYSESNLQQFSSSPRSSRDSLALSKNAEEKLVEACSKILDAIMDNKERVPRQVCRLCRFISDELELLLLSPRQYSRYCDHSHLNIVNLKPVYALGF